MLITYEEGPMDQIEQSSACEFLESHAEVIRQLDDPVGMRFLVNNERFWLIEELTDEKIVMRVDGLVDGKWLYRATYSSKYYNKYEIDKEETSHWDDHPKV